MKKTLILIPILLAFLLTMPVAAAEGYSDILTPGPFGNTTISWKVVDTPEVPFSLYWSGTGNWLAQEESMMSYSVAEIGDDVQGPLSLGNLTWVANDTDLAMDLTLGVWGLTPFLPGLIIKNSAEDIEALVLIADASAERVFGNYMNGSIQSLYEDVIVAGTVYSCVTFNYEQDSSGFGEPQETFLAYDTVTGILVQANTTYSFGVPYSLVLELSSIDSSRGLIPVVVIASGIGIVVLVVIVKLAKK